MGPCEAFVIFLGGRWGVHCRLCALSLQEDDMPCQRQPDKETFLWVLSYPNFVWGPLLDDVRPFFGPREVLGTHH